MNPFRGAPYGPSRVAEGGQWHRFDRCSSPLGWCPMSDRGVLDPPREMRATPPIRPRRVDPPCGYPRGHPSGYPHPPPVYRYLPGGGANPSGGLRTHRCHHIIAPESLAPTVVRRRRSAMAGHILSVCATRAGPLRAIVRRACTHRHLESRTRFDGLTGTPGSAPYLCSLSSMFFCKERTVFQNLPDRTGAHERPPRRFVRRHRSRNIRQADVRGQLRETELGL